MLFTRKIGKFLRGNTSPFQLYSATLLGALIGSLPGISHGPALFVLLLFLLVVLNANLLVAGLVLVLVKLLTLLLLPVFFHLGALLLEGGLGAVVAPLVNAPVLAWFGLEYYVMLPSLLTGLVTGLILGWGLTRLLGNFRARMARMESDSEKFRAYTSKGWVKALAWILFGGIRGKKSWSELAAAKGGLPVRPVGILLVLGLTVLGWVGLKFLDSTIVTTLLREELAQLNGATVDVGEVVIETGRNSVTIRHLALADPSMLKRNRFAAETLEMDISGAQLLAKKLVLDRVQVTGAQTGSERTVPGRVVVPTDEPEAGPEPEPGDEAEEAVPLARYLEQGSEWRERLQTINRWYDRLVPQDKEGAEAAEKAAEEPERESWREQLERRAQEAGYANVQAKSLIRDNPRLQIRALEIGELRSEQTGAVFSINGANLSTNPALLRERGSLQVKRTDGDFSLEVELPYEAKPATTQLKVAAGNVEVAELEKAAGRELPMKGGTVSLRGSGTISGSELQLPLEATLRNSELRIAGKSIEVAELPIQVGLTGSLRNPRLAVDREALQDAAGDALKEAGKRKVREAIEEKAGDKLKGLLPFGD